MKRRVEEHNLKEEIKDIVDRSIKSGISNDLCAVFRILREDRFSPRGKAMILNQGLFEKSVYDCNLCKACEQGIRNTNLCEAFRKAREVLVLKNKEIPENKEMIENLRKTGNVYGVVE
ncbi:hypothetical protein CMI42_02660 [Candidatus Pacearchaeota archaeon]|nr:hypothetical protein [Candidatus Pacearchaeota archaeon]|tara:strand:- start:1681 stop:2034 length:354 start_codon:yes stop_codon:yes gene_type:complete